VQAKKALRVTFDSRLKLEFHGSKVTPLASEKLRPDWEMACKSVEQAENHEKGPRCSWERNQMGNVS
jgi:hypothetical protein